MKVRCPKCGYSGEIWDQLVPKEGKFAVCPKCKEKIFVSHVSTNSPEYSHTFAGDPGVSQIICPGCGAAVEKPAKLSTNTFRCDYCGSTIVINEASSGFRGKTEDLLELARFSEKAGDYVMAHYYYTKLLEVDAKNQTFWLGKARNAGYSSSYKSPRIKEMIQAFQHVISMAENSEKEELEEMAGLFIWQRCLGSYSALKPYSLSAIHVKKTIYYCTYMVDIIKGLVLANAYLKDSIDRIDKILEIARSELYESQSSEIKDYRKEILNIFMEKKRQLDPDYFLREELRIKKTNRTIILICGILIAFFLLLMCPSLFID